MKRRKGLFIFIFVVVLSATGGAATWYFLNKKTTAVSTPFQKRGGSFQASTLKLRGYALLRQKKPEEALPVFQKALELDPHDKKLEQLVKSLEDYSDKNQ